MFLKFMNPIIAKAQKEEILSSELPSILAKDDIQYNYKLFDKIWKQNKGKPNRLYKTLEESNKSGINYIHLLTFIYSVLQIIAPILVI